MAKQFTTKKGLTLPLLNLRGKDYLQVAHRIQWLAHEVPHYDITTQAIELDEDSAVYKATIKILEKSADGHWHVSKTASATKSENKKGFADFIEKAETGAIGRALAMLGYGTQFTGDELDEGVRLADSPTTPGTTKAKTKTTAAATGGFKTKTATTTAAKPKRRL